MLIASAEWVSVLFLLIILFGLFSTSVLEKDKTRYFRRGLICLIFSLSVDAISYSIESIAVPPAVLFVFNMLAFTTVDIVIPYYATYMVEEVREKASLSRWNLYVIFFLCTIDIAFNFLGSFAGKTFTIVDGAFVPGPWYNSIGVIPCICFLYLAVLILIKRREIVNHMMALVLYLLFPLVSIVIQMINTAYALTMVACALSATLIYVTILTREVSESHTKEQMISEVSVLDLMTGFKNRNAFQALLGEIPQDENVGFVCCDINALKHINDTKGVTAGDSVILELADILKRSFDASTIFRVGDDNFFVVVRSAREVEFNGLVNVFRKKVLNANFIAAVGSAYGPASDLYKIISASEDDMQTDKLGFYQSRGLRRF